MSDTEGHGFEEVHGPSTGNGAHDAGEVTPDNLIEKATLDYRIAYQPEVIEFMVELKGIDLVRYIDLYTQLKRIKDFSAGLFNEAIAARERTLSPGDPGADPDDVLLSIVNTFAGFRTDNDVVFFDINVGDHRETLRARSERMISRVRALYYDMTGGRSVSTDKINLAIDTVAARIEWSGELRPVFCRIGADDDDDLYLDLHQPDWSYVRIAPAVWEVCQRPALSGSPEDAAAADMPVRFLYSRNASPLPTPKRGGSINMLRPFVVQREGREDDENNFTLIVGWLIGALHPKGPYPGMGVGGPPGSGKTTLVRQLRRTVDPYRAMSRGAPKNERDLMISSARSHIQSSDNLSEITPELSDAMCRLSTGGGLATRTLYSDDEETVFDNCRPIIFAAINEVVTRPDLADRFISLILPARSKELRRTDAAVEEEFQAAWPLILGALLDAMVVGLRRLQSMQMPEDLPRMAGFAALVAACEPGLGWEEGTFLKAYHANIKSVANTVMESDPVAFAIVKWVTSFPGIGSTWTGPAEQALSLINAAAGVSATASKHWPKTARGLVNRFRTLAPYLARFGVTVTSGALLHGRTQWTATRGEPLA
jgi:hypothetical protein